MPVLSRIVRRIHRSVQIRTQLGSERIPVIVATVDSERNPAVLDGKERVQFPNRRISVRLVNGASTLQSVDSRIRTSDRTPLDRSVRYTDRYLVDPASSHMLVSKIKPCMSKHNPLNGKAAHGSLQQLKFIRYYYPTWITAEKLELIHAIKLKLTNERIY